MAIYYVYSGATGGNTGVDWANAYTSLFTAASAAINGDTILLDYRHSETGSTAVTFPCSIISCEQDGATGYFRRSASGAQLTQSQTTAAGDISIEGTLSNLCNVYGINFSAGRLFTIYFSVATECTLTYGANNTNNGRLFLDTVGSITIINDSILDFAGTGTNVNTEDKIVVGTRAYTELNGCTFLANQATFQANKALIGFQGNDGKLMCANGDFSQVNFDTLASSNGGGDSSNFINCSLPTSMTTIFNVTASTGRHSFVGVSNDTDDFQTLIRDGFLSFSSDATVTLAHTFSYLFESEATLTSKVGGAKSDIWNGRLDMSTSRTFDVEFVQDGTTATLDDAQIWLTVVYRDASNNVVRETQRPATLADVTTHPTSAAAWTGVSATNSKQKMSITTTTAGAADSAVSVSVFVSEPSLSVYVCPDVTVT